MELMKFLLIFSVLCIQGFTVLVHGACSKQNEMPSDCANPCLQEKCSDLYYNGDAPVACTFDCPQGCVCKEGFILDDITNNGCIPTETCPKLCCPANREYITCGGACPPSCIHPEGLPCRAKCRDGCFCRKGLVEDGSGNCIPLEHCPLNCGKNEIEDSCASPCQPSCLDPHPNFCDGDCNRQCICRPPYVKDLNTNECIDKAQCEKQCPGKNQAYYCGTVCPTNCSNWQDTIPCTEQCVLGCHCKNGYVLDENKNCILPEYCSCRL